MNTAKAQKTESMAVQKLATMTTEQLISLFEDTNTRNEPEIPAVRGWLMDALELRNPQAFDAWLSGDKAEPSPRGFFM